MHDSIETATSVTSESYRIQTLRQTHGGANLPTRPYFTRELPDMATVCFDEAVRFDVQVSVFDLILKCIT